MRLCPSCRQLAAARADVHIPEASAMPAAPAGHADEPAIREGDANAVTVKGDETPATGVQQ